MILVASYALIGLAFALLFAFILVQKMDAQAEGATLGFRLLVVPGAAILWPYLLWRYLKRPA